MSRIIFIIGMSGAGKSRWGEIVSQTYNLPFIDLDCFIEATEGKTIAEIFRDSGETGFRKIESQLLRQVVLDNNAPLIISCGGGTPIDPDNLQFMKEHGCLVYLKATIATIIENLNEQIVERPMLTNGIISPSVRLNELYEKRKKIYEQANYTLTAENLAVQDFEPILHLCTELH